MAGPLPDLRTADEPQSVLPSMAPTGRIAGSRRCVDVRSVEIVTVPARYLSSRSILPTPGVTTSTNFFHTRYLPSTWYPESAGGQPHDAAQLSPTASRRSEFTTAKAPLPDEPCERW